MIELLGSSTTPSKRSYQRRAELELVQNLAVDEFKELVTQLYDAYGEDFHDAVLEFSYQVCDKLGASCYRSQLYHILIGSTPDLAAVDMDLKGELSTLQFVHDFQCRWQETA